MSNPRFSSKFQAQAMRCFMLTALLFCCATCLQVLHAQTGTLSIQGILKKNNGDAVSDGSQAMTFKLYTAATGGTAVWTETQPDVEVSSGIYSAVLGSVTPLNLAFTQVYYLGVTVGGAEMTPRLQLTGSPYAFALIGASNVFPGAGLVKADSINLKGGVLAKGGAPGLNGANHNGYAFTGGNGDNDSGLFSTSNGKVSMYVNNVEVLAATPNNVTVTGNVTASGNVSAGNVALANGGTIKYNGVSDWRLLDVDNFDVDNEGWLCYNEYNSASTTTYARVNAGGPINAGYMLRPSNNAGNAFRKQLNLTGIPHTQVKVVFTFYIFNSMDGNESVYGGFSTTAVPNFNNVGEAIVSYIWHNMNDKPQTQLDAANTDLDLSVRGEMVISNSSDNLYLILDSTMNEDTNNENYGISNIEIWIK